MSYMQILPFNFSSTMYLLSNQYESTIDNMIKTSQEQTCLFPVLIIWLLKCKSGNKDNWLQGRAYSTSKLQLHSQKTHKNTQFKIVLPPIVLSPRQTFHPLTFLSREKTNPLLFHSARNPLSDSHLTQSELPSIQSFHPDRPPMQ